MIALYIITAVLLLLLAIAMLPIALTLKYKDEVSVRLSLWDIKLKEFPKKKKKIKISDYSQKAIKKRQKKAQKPQKEKPKSSDKAQTPKKGLLDNLGLIKELLTVIVKGVWGKLKIKASKIVITVATDDAAKTAMLFPAVNTAVLGIVTFLDNESKLKSLDKSDIAVRADFTAQKSTADIEISFSMRLWQILGILFATALKYVSQKTKK